MKIKTARSVLSITWIVGGSISLLIVVLQTFLEVYGDASQNWDKGLQWIMPLLFPVLGTIIGSWSVGENEVDEFPVSSTPVFWLTMFLSIVYLAILLSGIVIGAVVYHHTHWDNIMRSTGWILSVFQAFISVALAKFFIENIRPPRSG
jgi:cellobiose-specific phosphotransferase system component IIC